MVQISSLIMEKMQFNHNHNNICLFVLRFYCLSFHWVMSSVVAVYLATLLLGRLCLLLCVEVLQPSQPNRVMSSVVSLLKHTFTGQA